MNEVRRHRTIGTYDRKNIGDMKIIIYEFKRAF